MVASSISVAHSPARLVVEARDLRTIEIRQFFPLPETESTTTEYLTDMYFFFPAGFGPVTDTLSNRDFYKRSQVYMRMHSPDLKLQELYDLNSPDNPATILRRKLPLLLTKEAPSGDALTALAQLLGAEVADAVDVKLRFLKRSIRSANIHNLQLTTLESELTSFCADLLSTLNALRRIRLKALAHGAVVHEELRSALYFCAEYLGAVTDEALAELATALDRSDGLRDGTGLLTQMRLEVARTAERVNGWRIDQGLLVPWRADHELFTYRMGLLKKELQQSLYVNTRGGKRDPFVRNTAAMIAAGLAATWATLAQLPLWTGAWATEEGLLFLGVAVGAYILKDRIKEWVRQALAVRWTPWDEDRKVLGDALAQVELGAFHGRAKERFHLLNEEEIPQEIKEIRSRERTVSGLTIENENVIHYARMMSFQQANGNPVPPRYGVQQRFRFNLADFLARLDDPVESVRYFDSRTGRFKRKEMPRVYHINLVVSQSEGAENKRKNSKFRLVVNQKQVLRVEAVEDL